MQATMTSDNFTGLAVTPENKKFMINYHNHNYLESHITYLEHFNLFSTFFFPWAISAPCGKTSCDNSLLLTTEEKPGAGCNVPQPNNTTFEGQTFP